MAKSIHIFVIVSAAAVAACTTSQEVDRIASDRLITKSTIEKANTIVSVDREIEGNDLGAFCGTSILLFYGSYDAIDNTKRLCEYSVGASARGKSIDKKTLDECKTILLNSGAKNDSDT